MIGAIYCVGLLALGGALAFVLGLSHPPWLAHAAVKEELVKVAIQVIVFGLAGGGVKVLLDRKAEQRWFRSDMLERLGNAHRSVYRVRRLLPLSRPEEFPQLLGELMDARQGLGATYHAARVWGLGARVKDIQRETEAMRKYLEDVICGALASHGAPERAAYEAFLNWRVADSYEHAFKKRYLAAKKMIDASFEPQ